MYRNELLLGLELTDEELQSLRQLFGNCKSWTWHHETDTWRLGDKSVPAHALASLYAKGLLYMGCRALVEDGREESVQPLLTYIAKTSLKHGHPQWVPVPQENVMEKEVIKHLAQVLADKLGCELDIEGLVEEAYDRANADAEWRGPVKIKNGLYQFRGYRIAQHNVWDSENSGRVGKVWVAACTVPDVDYAGKVCRTLESATKWVLKYGQVAAPGTVSVESVC